MKEQGQGLVAALYVGKGQVCFNAGGNGGLLFKDIGGKSPNGKKPRRPPGEVSFTDISADSEGPMAG